MSSSASNAPLASSASNASGVGAAATSATAVPGGAGSAANTRWRYLAFASFALWIIAAIAVAAWWFTRARRTRKLARRDHDASVPFGTSEAPASARPASAREHPRLLRERMLDAARAGDAASCERALLTWARATRPAVTHAGLLRDALSDSAQRKALDALQRVRWHGGDAASVCDAVVEAFADGFAWHGDGKPARDDDDALPPLYPR